MTKITRAERVVHWIEKYCVAPNGERRGLHVRLTNEERTAVRRIYDDPEGVKPVPVSGQLAAFLGLYHLCGPEWKADPRPQCDSGVFTIWNATGPDLRAVLKRDGEAISCPELGTEWPTAGLTRLWPNYYFYCRRAGTDVAQR
jgi:hypothetical protein